MGRGAADQHGRRRAAAIVALLTLVLAVLAVLAFTVGGLVYLVASVVGVAVAVTGGWYLVANRGTLRVVASLVAVVGAVMALAGLVAAGTEVWSLVLAGVLVAVSVLCAKYATNRRVDSVAAADLVTPRPPARHPVLIMNPNPAGGRSSGSTWSSSAVPAASNRWC